MKALRAFLIALPIALILSWQPSTAFWHGSGAAIAALIALVTGNVTIYVNPSAVSTTPCGLNGGSTCQPGNDSNTCMTIAAPCKTFQQAVYIVNQTLLWGANIGTAQIFLGNGTYPETVALGATIGTPSKCSSASCSNVFTQLNGVEIIGNDSSPSSVVVSPPNGTCNKGAWGMPGSVLNFFSGTYVIHGWSANASSEATYECSVIGLWSGVHLATSGVMNVGPAAGGGEIIHAGGGGQIGVTDFNVTIGNGVTSCFINIFNGAQFLDDQGTINFVDSGTLAGSGFGSAVVCGDGSGTNTFGAFDTITGGISSGACYSLTGNTLLSGALKGNMNQQLVSGCSVAASTADTGTNFQGFITTQALVTHLQYNNGAVPPVISSCGSGAAFTNNSADVTDSAGTIAVGSGATGCTLTFVTSWRKYPNCTVVGSNGAVVPAINGSGPYTGWTVTASLTGKLVYTCIFPL
jgi:hypothetical protein